MGSNYMTGLLWALETVAWDAEYLTRVVVSLGELASKYRNQAEELESQGYYRLANSLRELAVSYERDAERLASRDVFDW